jgi:hypothetical protein
MSEEVICSGNLAEVNKGGEAASERADPENCVFVWYGGWRVCAYCAQGYDAGPQEW